MCYQTLRIQTSFLNQLHTGSLLHCSKLIPHSREDARMRKSQIDWGKDIWSLFSYLHYSWLVDSGVLIVQAKPRITENTLQTIKALIFTSPLSYQCFLSHELWQCQLQLLPGASSSPSSSSFLLWEMGFCTLRQQLQHRNSCWQRQSLLDFISVLVRAYWSKCFIGVYLTAEFRGPGGMQDKENQ